jgi:hypothetical protein
MGFNNNQLEELKYIEIRLRQIESMSRESGIDLENWLPEMDFPDCSTAMRSEVLARNEQRGALFASTAQQKVERESDR